MRLVRYGERGAERPGLVDTQGLVRSLEGVIDDIAGEVLLPQGLDRLRTLEPSQLPVIDAGVRFGPCVNGVGKFICVGLNYSDHAAETELEVPDEPVLFFKATSAISGPFDDLVLPYGGDKTDWEVELGVVIGRPGVYIEESAALSHVAGYCLVHDVSERSFQLERFGQWVKGKSCDTFGPIGPYLVTADEIRDPQDIALWLEVDGERVQDGSTRTMVFSVAHLISYISQFMSLQMGDIISTGTPAGVGLAMSPPATCVRAKSSGSAEQAWVNRGSGWWRTAARLEQNRRPTAGFRRL